MLMKVFVLMTLMTITGVLDGTLDAETVVLENEYLRASWKPSASGLRLAEVTNRSTGATFHFGSADELALALVEPEDVHDPDYEVHYTEQQGFQYDGRVSPDDAARLVLRFRHDDLTIDVTYEIDAQRPILQKTITGRVTQDAVYVAGVRHWNLTSKDTQRLWPAKETPGQPVVLQKDQDGCILSLEWMRALNEFREDEIHLSWRPGYTMEPGESRQLSTGAIVLYEQTFEDDPLTAARHAFFDHVAQRVNPVIPCPIKFTTWGPWMRETRADRCLEVMDDLGYIGADLFHFDAGWQWPDHPLGRRMPTVRGADTETWDKAMTLPERTPDGLWPIKEAAEANGMKLSLWFDASGHVFVYEGEEWAVRDKDGKAVYRGMWEKRLPEAPVQSFASEYGDRIREFVLEMLERYDLGGVMFDNNQWIPNAVDHGVDHECLANGWNSTDVQFRRLMEIFEECNRRRPGIYRFLCNAISQPWAMQSVTHIHAGDPGTSRTMQNAAASDCPARAMAHERRMAWRRHYLNFVPPWGVKGDIAGWSIQQHSPIPVTLAHTGELIPAGEGWTQNMFTCFATTSVRDIRFSFEQMPKYDRDILKEWLAWDRTRSHYIFNCRPLYEMSEDPNEGLAGFSHVGKGKGVIYLFNASFEPATVRLKLDENAGFASEDKDLNAHMVYPLKARLGSGRISYGQQIEIPLPAKECVVIEVGLDAPDGVQSYDAYDKAVMRVQRSFNTLFLTSPDSIVKAMRKGKVSLEVGDSKRDARLAMQMADTFGAALGIRTQLEEWLATPTGESNCRLIIGTHEGLSAHPEVGSLFQETLYSRYVAWNGKLYSAPVVFSLESGDRPTYCLVAPRPEQLAQLAIELANSILAGAKAAGMPSDKAQWNEFSLSTTVPDTMAVLRFRPLMKMQGALVMPDGLDRVRYEISARVDGEDRLLWSEVIAPFAVTHAAREGHSGWWKDRVISLADLAGEEVSIRLSAAHVDGRQEDPRAVGGFDRVEVMQLAGPER